MCFRSQPCIFFINADLVFIAQGKTPCLQYPWWLLNKIRQGRHWLPQFKKLSVIHWYYPSSQCNRKCTTAIQQQNTYVAQVNSNKIESQKKSFFNLPFLLLALVFQAATQRHSKNFAAHLHFLLHVTSPRVSRQCLWFPSIHVFWGLPTYSSLYLIEIPSLYTL